MALPCALTLAIMTVSGSERMSECVTYGVDGPVAVITIDRPDARNAVSPEVAQGIEAAIDAAEADDGVWVLVLTGTPPVFSAGADLKAINEGRAAELSTARDGSARSRS
jgi:enoyl-CoA hydratase